MSRHAGERKSTLARASHKSIPPRNAGALGGRLQQRSGVQTQFWSVVFIRDSLLQVNLNCLGPSAAASKPSSRISAREPYLPFLWKFPNLTRYNQACFWPCLINLNYFKSNGGLGPYEIDEY
jgi:hypothetical protein